MVTERVAVAVVTATARTNTLQKQGGGFSAAFLGLKSTRSAYTMRMRFFRRSYTYIKGKYQLLAEKKYTTLAGTLVFFFIMSVVPLSFWLTLLIGKLPLSTERVFELGVFHSVRGVFSYLQQEARNATASVSVLLLITTLYSSTNLFYQMRRSGELIYGYSHKRAGWRVRLGALALTFIVMFVCIAFLVLLALGSLLFSRFFSPFLEKIADYVLLIAVSYGVVLLLNAYVCPYKRPLKSFLKGTTLTVAAWVLAVTGFAIYLKIGNIGKLYGALSALIIFLLWLYVLMVCFIVGVIVNSEKKQQKLRNYPHKSRDGAHNNVMKIRSGLIATLGALLFSFATLKSGSIRDVNKVYLGEYQCETIMLGGEERLDEFRDMVLELRQDNQFELRYKLKNGYKGKQTGSFVYDDQKQTLMLTMGGNGEWKREFPIKKGRIHVSVPIGNEILYIRFTQK